MGGKVGVSIIINWLLVAVFLSDIFDTCWHWQQNGYALVHSNMSCIILRLVLIKQIAFLNLVNFLLSQKPLLSSHWRKCFLNVYEMSNNSSVTVNWLVCASSCKTDIIIVVAYQLDHNQLVTCLLTRSGKLALWFRIMPVPATSRDLC